MQAICTLSQAVNRLTHARMLAIVRPNSQRGDKTNRIQKGPYAKEEFSVSLLFLSDSGPRTDCADASPCMAGGKIQATLRSRLQSA